MQDAYFWIIYFGASLFTILITAYAFRPCALNQYREVKQVIFIDDRKMNRRRSPD